MFVRLALILTISYVVYGKAVEPVVGLIDTFDLQPAFNDSKPKSDEIIELLPVEPNPNEPTDDEADAAGGQIIELPPIDPIIFDPETGLAEIPTNVTFDPIVIGPVPELLENAPPPLNCPSTHKKICYCELIHCHKVGLFPKIHSHKGAPVSLFYRCPPKTTKICYCKQIVCPICHYVVHGTCIKIPGCPAFGRIAIPRPCPL